MPVPAELHIDAALTDFSVAVSLQMESQFVARRAFPTVPVPKQSDKYFIYDSDDLLRSDAQRYSGKGATAGRDFSLSEGNYFVEPFAVHYDVGRHEVANADAALDVEEDAATILAQDLLIAEEVEFTSNVMAASLWGTTVTGGTNFTRWDDAASTPIEDITTGDVTILTNTGRRPNKLVVGYATWAQGFRNHPDVLDRVKYSARGVVTSELVAAVLEVDEVLVASAVRNTATEGLTASNALIVGDDALLLHSPANTGVRQPAAGKSFVWNAYGPTGVLTERFDIPEEGAYPRIQTFRAFDHKITSTALGYFFDDCIT